MSDELALPDSPEEFVHTVGWQFAKSMPEIPHEYTLRGKRSAGIDPPPVEWHDWMVDYIEENGYRAKWHGRWFTYLELDGFKYWPLPGVINRERLPQEEVAA